MIDLKRIAELDTCFIYLIFFISKKYIENLISYFDTACKEILTEMRWKKPGCQGKCSKSIKRSVIGHLSSITIFYVFFSDKIELTDNI